MKKYYLPIILFVLTVSIFPQRKNLDGLLSPGEIASNFLKLHPDSIIYANEEKSKKWNYEQGLMMEAFFQLFDVTHNNQYLNYIKKNLDYYVNSDGKIKTYKLEDQNLDNISSGRALLNMYTLTKNEKYKKAADILREQLSKDIEVSIIYDITKFTTKTYHQELKQWKKERLSKAELPLKE